MQIFAPDVDAVKNRICMSIEPSTSNVTVLENVDQIELRTNFGREYMVMGIVG